MGCNGNRCWNQIRRIVLCYVPWDERKGTDRMQRTTHSVEKNGDRVRLYNGKGEVVRKRKEER